MKTALQLANPETIIEVQFATHWILAVTNSSSYLHATWYYIDIENDLFWSYIGLMNMNSHSSDRFSPLSLS